MAKQLHPKIQELKQRAAPITYSNVVVNASGKLATEGEDLLDKRQVEGYLFVWGLVDSHGTKFIKGCCSKSIQERGPNSDAKYKITFQWQHDGTDPLGLFEELTEDDYGLYFRTKPLDDVPNADRTIKQVRSGTINQFSGGFNFIWDKMEWDATDDSLVCYEIDLMEGSVVTRASMSETYAIRSADNMEQAQSELADDTEDFIKSIPRKQQLELRQLFARHKTLTDNKPLELRQAALETEEPLTDHQQGLDYEYLKNNLKDF